MISIYNWFGLRRRHNSVPPETTVVYDGAHLTSLHLTMDISIMLFWNGFVEWQGEWQIGGKVGWHGGINGYHRKRNGESTGLHNDLYISVYT
jgi:hypothetical protein